MTNRAYRQKAALRFRKQDSFNPQLRDTWTISHLAERKNNFLTQHIHNSIKTAFVPLRTDLICINGILHYKILKRLQSSWNCGIWVTCTECLFWKQNGKGPRVAEILMTVVSVDQGWVRQSSASPYLGWRPEIGIWSNYHEHFCHWMISFVHAVLEQSVTLE